MKLCGFEAGLDKPFFLIAGPCVVESEQLQIDVAGHLKEITASLGIPFIFKSSYDKANRKSGKAYRGPGMEKGLRILELVKKEVGVPVLTDVHEDTPVNEVAAVVDIVQTPAFLVRQTSFLERVAKAGKPVHVKRGQFMAPWDLADVVTKLKDFGNDQILLCERGACFGFGGVVVLLQFFFIPYNTHPFTTTTCSGFQDNGITYFFS